MGGLVTVDVVVVDKVVDMESAQWWKPAKHPFVSSP